MIVRLSVFRLGFAFAGTLLVLYFGCVLSLLVLGPEKSVRFFNTLVHGVDFSRIVRTQILIDEAFIGMITTFVLGWLTGATVASLYNLGLGNTATAQRRFAEKVGDNA